MSTPDFNLLTALNVLLAEGGVTRAAHRLRLSPSAMSRALARLREATGDPLLVRVGRGLVPTPRARDIRDRVSSLVQDVEAVLRPAALLDPRRLAQSFTLRTSDGFVENFGPGLIAQVNAEAPGVRLRFVQKENKDRTPLREGSADLETGVVDDTTGPEVCTQMLFQDRYIGAVREGHPLSTGRITPARYASGMHILASRRSPDTGPMDDALALLGLQRTIVTVVSGFSAALALARASDLIASVPERHTGNLRAGMHCFPLPVSTPAFTVSMMWHPRMDADAAHRWLREQVFDACSPSRARRPGRGELSSGGAAPSSTTRRPPSSRNDS
jgi:DNA-binding transcriptional LysR family regulator